MGLTVKKWEKGVFIHNIFQTPAPQTTKKTTFIYLIDVNLTIAGISVFLSETSKCKKCNKLAEIVQTEEGMLLGKIEHYEYCSKFSFIE